MSRLSKNAYLVAKVLRRDVPKPSSLPVMSPVYGEPSARNHPAPCIRQVLKWQHCYTAVDLHPEYDTQTMPHVAGIDGFLELLGVRLNRARGALKEFNRWWDKQKDAAYVVKEIWG